MFRVQFSIDLDLFGNMSVFFNLFSFILALSHHSRLRRTDIIESLRQLVLSSVNGLPRSAKARQEQAQLRPSSRPCSAHDTQGHKIQYSLNQMRHGRNIKCNSSARWEGPHRQYESLLSKFHGNIGSHRKLELFMR